MLRASLLLVCLSMGIATRAQVLPPCHSASFNVALDVSDDFEHQLGRGLSFRIKSEKEPGWFFDIVPADAQDNDFIYPVNFPLRFNPVQYLGPAYSESLKSSLANPHEVRFLLDRTDYDHVSSLIGDVLWPYQTSDPDKALSQYTSMVAKAKKGWLRVTVPSYRTDAKTGEVAHIELRVQVTTPSSFKFVPELKPRPGPCPAESNRAVD